jgi:hypothetical protein
MFALLLSNGAIALALQEFEVTPIQLPLSGNVPNDVYLGSVFKIGDTYLAESILYLSDYTPILYASDDLETWNAVYDSGGGGWNGYSYNGDYIMTYIGGKPHYSENAVDWYEVQLPSEYIYGVSSPYQVDDWFLFRANRMPESTTIKGVLAIQDFENWKFIEDFPTLEENHVLDEYALRYNDDAWYIYSSFTNHSAEVAEDVYSTNFYKASALPAEAGSWAKIGNIGTNAPISPYYAWLTWTNENNPIIRDHLGDYYTSSDWTDWTDYTPVVVTDPNNALRFSMQQKLSASMGEQSLYYRDFIVDGSKQIGLYSGTPESIGKSVFQLSIDAGDTFTPIVAQIYYNGELVSPKTESLSADTSLSALSLSSGTLTPAFNSARYIYTASVANSISSLTITATPTDINATVRGDGIETAKELAVGENLLTITVTAENGTTTKDYVVTVTRASSSGSSSSGGGASSSSSSSDKSAPAADGKSTVEYSASGPTATVALPDIKVTELINNSGKNISIDLSDVSGVTSTQLPPSALDKISDADKGLTLKLPTGDFTLDSNALASLALQTNADVVISIENITDISNLSPEQQEAFKNSPDVWSITITSGGKEITAFNGGTLTISKPVNIPPEWNPNWV